MASCWGSRLVCPEARSDDGDGDIEAGGNAYSCLDSLCP